MAKTEAQRQKQLAKKRSKQNQHKREIVQQKQKMQSLAGQMDFAALYPVVASYLPESVAEGGAHPQGMCSAVIARKIPSGEIAFAVFLIDAFCLGVKNAIGKVSSPAEFNDAVEQMKSRSNLVSVPPSSVKKFVLGAADFASECGFNPHKDFKKTAPILGGIDVDDCKIEFTYGKDGRPYYISGPFDDSVRQKLIFQRLTEKVGEGNFNFLILGGPSAGDYDSDLIGDYDDNGFDDEDFDDGDDMVIES